MRPPAVPLGGVCRHLAVFLHPQPRLRVRVQERLELVVVRQACPLDLGEDHANVVQVRAQDQYRALQRRDLLDAGAEEVAHQPHDVHSVHPTVQRVRRERLEDEVQAYARSVRELAYHEALLVVSVLRERLPQLGLRQVGVCRDVRHGVRYLSVVGFSCLGRAVADCSTSWWAALAELGRAWVALTPILSIPHLRKGVWEGARGGAEGRHWTARWWALAAARRASQTTSRVLVSGVLLKQFSPQRRTSVQDDRGGVVCAAHADVELDGIRREPLDQPGEGVAAAKCEACWDLHTPRRPQQAIGYARTVVVIGEGRVFCADLLGNGVGVYRFVVVLQRGLLDRRGLPIDVEQMLVLPELKDSRVDLGIPCYEHHGGLCFDLLLAMSGLDSRVFLFCAARLDLLVSMRNAYRWRGRSWNAQPCLRGLPSVS